MDIVSHGLWGGIVFGRQNKKSFRRAFFFRSIAAIQAINKTKTAHEERFLFQHVDKPDSVPPAGGDGNLSRPAITHRLKRLFRDCFRNRDAVLHSSKDLAVSSLLSYPYNRAKPTSLGLGFPRSFQIGTFLLAPLALRQTGVTRYLCPIALAI